MSDLLSSSVARPPLSHPGVAPAAAPHDGVPDGGALADGEKTNGAAWRADALTWRVAACVAAFAMLALALALTRNPQADEGHFASAGASLAFQGRLVMPMWTDWIPTLDQRLYSNMPLYFVLLGGWFRAFGDGWLAMRSLSVVWGCVLVVCGTATLWSATRDRRTTLVGAVLLAFSYDLVNFASARYDIMAAALSAAACTSYLLLRERSLARALLVANACLAAGALTHPYAIFGLVNLGILVLMLDVRRVRARHVAAAAAPYAVAFAAWGVYIAQDPAMFREQFGVNASGRFRDAANPLSALGSELRQRYLVGFAGWRPGAPLAMRAKLGVLLAYAAGVVGVFVLPELRRRRTVLALGVATLAGALLLALLDATRWYIYFVHVIPLYVLCLALTAGALLGRGPRWAGVVRAGTAGMALFTVASVVYRARLDVHHRAYLPAVRYLQSHLRPGDLVVAGGEFGVGLGYARHVHDDPHLGYARDRRPRFIVMSSDYRRVQGEDAALDPALRQHLEGALAQFRPVFSTEAGSTRYDIYERRESEVGPSQVGTSKDPALGSTATKP